MSHILKTVVLLHIISIFASIVIAQNVGELCVGHNRESEGICTLVMDCEEALKEVKINRRHNFRRCGFRGVQEIVCCPRSSNKFGDSGSTERSRINIGQRIADRECEKYVANSIPNLNLHIIGGEAASVGEFPHMVALGYDRGNGYEFDCGGSLISENFVLTAAHCLDTADRIEPTIIRTGVIEIGGSGWDPETDVDIARLIIHPGYSRREKYDDLALLRLNKSLSFSSTVNAVCLETRDTTYTSPLVITGWGTNSNTRNTRSNILLKANVSAVNSAECEQSYTNWRKLPRGIATSQLCAGDKNGLRDTCQGDSGGPLQRSDASGNYRLVGVTSFGRGCGSPIPGVYTKLASYVDWIEPIVWPR